MGARINASVKHRLNEYEALIEEQCYTPLNKSPNEKRVFLVGESAARGVPYTLDYSVSGFLQKLCNVSGNENVKIINVGIPGRHSFSQRQMAPSLLKYRADAVILYAGNNDTRDFCNVLRDSSLAMLDFKLSWYSAFYAGLKGKILAWKEEMRRRSRHNSPGPPWRKTLAYLRDPVLGPQRKRLALIDFENNLDSLVQYLTQRGIVVYVAGLPIVHEAMPFGVDRPSGTNDSPPFQFYYLGKNYAERGDYEKAKRMYVHSKDLQIQSPSGDSQKNSVLRRIALRWHVPFIDLQSALEEASPHGIVGKNLFLDECHANTLGYKIIAAKMMETLCRSRLMEKACAKTRWNAWLRSLTGGEINKENLAREYLLVGIYSIRGTLWKPQANYAEAIGYLEEARKLSPENKNIYPFLAASYWKTGQMEKAQGSLDRLKNLDESAHRKALKDFPFLAQMNLAR